MNEQDIEDLDYYKKLRDLNLELAILDQLIDKLNEQIEDKNGISRTTTG